MVYGTQITYNELVTGANLSQYSHPWGASHRFSEFSRTSALAARKGLYAKKKLDTLSWGVETYIYIYILLCTAHIYIYTHMNIVNHTPHNSFLKLCWSLSGEQDPQPGSKSKGARRSAKFRRVYQGQGNS